MRDPSAEPHRPPGQRLVVPGAAAAGQRDRPGQPELGVQAAERVGRPGQPAGVPGAGERTSADDRLQAVDRGQRAAGHRRLRQGRGVHALADHARKRHTSRPAAARRPGEVSSTRMRVAIAGGGLGGLAAALFLCRAGVRDVRVFERQPSLGEIGAGIQVAPNAVRLLQRLGLERGIGARSRCPSRSPGSSGAGRTGASCSPRPSARRARRASARRTWPCTARICCRSWPLRVPAGVVALDCEVAGVDGDRFRFADGSASEPFDVLIGADGIHSVVRDGDRRSPGRPSSPGWPRTARWSRLRRRRRSPAARSARSGSARSATSSTTRSRAASRSTSSPPTRRVTGARSPGRPRARCRTSWPSSRAGTRVSCS